MDQKKANMFDDCVCVCGVDVAVACAAVSLILGAVLARFPDAVLLCAGRMSV